MIDRLTASPIPQGVLKGGPLGRMSSRCSNLHEQRRRGTKNDSHVLGDYKEGVGYNSRISSIY